MNFTKEIIDMYADKLLIGLTDEENKMVLEEFSIIDAHIKKINEIESIETVSPMSFALDDFSYNLREDDMHDNSDIDDILKNCSDVSGREVEIPKVVNKNESNE